MTEPILPVLTEVKPDDPTLLVKLEAAPPLTEARYKTHEPWTLDLMERTCFEFRAAGGFDSAKLDVSYNKVACEIMVGRGKDAMPWGYRPLSEPAPEPEAIVYEEVENKLPWFLKLLSGLGNRYTQGMLLVMILALLVIK